MRLHVRWTREFVVALYRLALHSFPSDVRRATGDAIVSTFARRLTEATRDSGKGAAARLVILELADVARTGLGLRLARPTRLSFPLAATSTVLVALCIVSVTQRVGPRPPEPSILLDLLEGSAPLGACRADFDGDGQDDLFLPSGAVAPAINALRRANRGSPRGARGEARGKLPVRLSSEQMSRLLGIRSAAAPCSADAGVVGGR